MESNALFSGKKGYHTFTKLIGVSPSGRILYLSHSYQGSVSDINFAKMQENCWYQDFTDEEWIMGDKGFKGLDKLHNTITPKVGKELGDEQQEYNKGVARVRIIVENAILAIKKWKICSQTCRTQASKKLGKFAPRAREHMVYLCRTNQYVYRVRGTVQDN